MKELGRLSLVALLLLGAVAHAGPRNKVAAREAFEVGIRHYNLSEFKDALDAFREAYRQYPDSTLLFNIGQCQRQLGDKNGAMLSFKAYLRETTNAPNRPEVQALINALEDSVREDEKMRNRPPQDPLGSVTPGEATQTAPTEPTARPAPAAETQPAAAALVSQPAPPTEKKKKRAWIWGVVAGAVAAAGLAVGLGVGLSPHDPAVTLGSVRGN